MSRFDYKKVMPRFNFIAIGMTLVALWVVGKAFYLMTVEKDFWLQVADRERVDSLSVKPVRGNILSCDGQLLASSLPEFKLYMDFDALHKAGNDSIWSVALDSICHRLNAIFPEQSAAAFRRHLEEGRRRRSRHWPIWNRRVDYNVFAEVRSMPVSVFRMGKYQSGFHYEEFNARKRAYGSLAERTIGTLYGAKDSARYGLELSFDRVLRGTDGIIHRRKVLNTFLDIVDTPPVDGADIVTTLDVNIQDLAERSLLKMLRKKEVNGDVGVAIVMEVATGDVKAIVNLDKCGPGEYIEGKNHAVSDLLEPGSVFKTASIMVALDQGKVDTTTMIDTGNGVWPMYGRQMRDHNWHRGGYGVLSLPQTLMFSSNIGVSRIIDNHYHKRPDEFVRGIYGLGLADNLDLPFVGSSPAIIRIPIKNKNGNGYHIRIPIKKKNAKPGDKSRTYVYQLWSQTRLPWMSIGYETQIPPISTLTFYNAIANGGRMVRPRFVKQVVKNGEVVKDYPTVVTREAICKEKTLREMQTILRRVVRDGLGKKAGSPSFAVSGKTGTAQISKGSAGYKSGGTNYLLSFAGYFPSEAPRYSCIVCIQKRGTPASGGGMCGPVFREIAEGIMAQIRKNDVSKAHDSLSVAVPSVMGGNIIAADYVLSHLGLPVRKDWGGSYADGNPLWGRARATHKTVTLTPTKMYGRSFMPDVTGMGARDAVYLVESRGVKTRIEGRGKVVSQSIGPGRRVRKGMVCTLVLQ